MAIESCLLPSEHSAQLSTRPPPPGGNALAAAPRASEFSDANYAAC